jgi:hypothetical protein
VWLLIYKDRLVFQWWRTQVRCLFTAKLELRSGRFKELTLPNVSTSMTHVKIGSGADSNNINLSEEEPDSDRTFSYVPLCTTATSNVTFSISSPTSTAVYPNLSSVNSPYSYGMYGQNSSSYRSYGDSHTNDRYGERQNSDLSEGSDMRVLAIIIRELGQGSNRPMGTNKVAGAVNKPQTYSGKITEDLDNFLQRFEAYAEFHRWGDHEKCTAMPNFLDSAAFRFFHSLPTEIRTNYAQLKERLNLKFNPNDLQLVNVQALFNRRQQKNEALETYLDSVMKLCDRSGKNPEEHFVVLIQGLRPALKNFVMSQNVANLQLP